MTYTLTRDGQPLGTFSEEGLVRLINDGQVQPTDLVWQEKEQRWIPLAEMVKQSDDYLAAQFARTLYAATPKVFITPALIAINLAIFVLMVLTGVSLTDPTLPQLIRWGADFGPLTTHGQWWRLLSAAFVHIGIIHVLMNMYVLWSSGRFTERLFGNASFLVLYLLAGLGGNVASVAWHPMTVAAGASGAVFGVYGGLLGFLLVQRKTIPKKTVTSLARGALVFIGYNVIFGLNPHIDMTAHVGGLICGFLAGCALARPIVPAAQAPGFARPLSVAVIGLAVIAAATLKLHAVDNAQSEWYRAELTSPSITVGKKDSVIYSGKATREEATALSQALQNNGFFGDRGAQVLLTKGDGGTVISFSVNGSRWEDPSFLAAIQSFGLQVADAVGGTPLRIELRDGERQVRKSIAIEGHRITIGENGATDVIEYSGTATQAEAQAVGETLREKGFFNGHGGLAIVAKGSDGAIVSLLVKEGVWDNPRFVPLIDALGKLLTKVVGSPLRIRLLDSSRRIKKEVTIQ